MVFNQQIKILYKSKMTSEYGRHNRSLPFSRAFTQGRKIPNKKVISEIQTSENQTKYEESIKLPYQSFKKSSLKNSSKNKYNSEIEIKNKNNLIKVNEQINSLKLNGNRQHPKNLQISSQRSKVELGKKFDQQFDYKNSVNKKQQYQSERLNKDNYNIQNQQVNTISQNPGSINSFKTPDRSQNQRLMKYSNIRSNDGQSQKYKNNKQEKKFSQINSIRQSTFFSPDEKTVLQNTSSFHPSILTSQVVETQGSKIKSIINQSRIKTKRIGEEQKVKKNLESFRVEFKKIQQIYEEKRLEQEAKNFILRLKREKRQFQGRLYMIKRNQQQKRRMKFYNQIEDKEEEQKIHKYKRLKNAQKNIELFKQKIAERQKQMKKMERSKSFNSDISRIDKKIKEFKNIQQEKPLPSESNILGRKYLKQHGRMKRRVRTENTDYPVELTRQQRQQLDKIRQKIDQLTKSFRI